jgi:hypothetical protein
MIAFPSVVPSIDEAPWNPFITKLDGKLAKRERLMVKLEPPGGREMTFRPTLLDVVEACEFRWLGHFLIPGLFDGEHIFELEDIGGKTRLIQREVFKGILVIPMLMAFGEKTERGFAAMNEALRARVDSGLNRRGE